MTSDDPRRQRPVEIKWVGAAEGPRTIGRIEIDGEHWGNVEWSYRREVWCIEDIWGPARGRVAVNRATLVFSSG